jgi:3-deoxy-D-manno-octulosonate 8-phosphate phosphatase (KDO 8-P phosphatase)
VAIISGRGSEAVNVRAGELGIEQVRLNCKRKLPAYEEVCREMGVRDEQVVVMGDDLTDIPLLRRAEVAITTEEASPEVKQVASFVTRTPGGRGCVREAIEMMLRTSGEWSRLLERYSETPPKDAL